MNEDQGSEIPAGEGAAGPGGGRRMAWRPVDASARPESASRDGAGLVSGLPSPASPVAPAAPGTEVPPLTEPAATPAEPGSGPINRTSFRERIATGGLTLPEPPGVAPTGQQDADTMLQPLHEPGDAATPAAPPIAEPQPAPAQPHVPPTAAGPMPGAADPQPAPQPYPAPQQPVAPEQFPSPLQYPAPEQYVAPEQNVAPEQYAPQPPFSQTPAAEPPPVTGATPIGLVAADDPAAALFGPSVSYDLRPPTPAIPPDPVTVRPDYVPRADSALGEAALPAVAPPPLAPEPSALPALDQPPARPSPLDGPIPSLDPTAPLNEPAPGASAASAIAPDTAAGWGAPEAVGPPSPVEDRTAIEQQAVPGPHVAADQELANRAEPSGGVTLREPIAPQVPPQPALDDTVLAAPADFQPFPDSRDTAQFDMGPQLDSASAEPHEQEVPPAPGGAPAQAGPVPPAPNAQPQAGTRTVNFAPIDGAGQPVAPPHGADASGTPPDGLVGAGAAAGRGSRRERRTGAIPTLTDEQVSPVEFAEPERSDDGRKKLMIGLIIAGVVLLIAAVVLFIMLNRPAPPSTGATGAPQTNAAQAPALTPSPNPSTRDFPKSLPQRVNDFVFTGIDSFDGWANLDVNEAYKATYSNGSATVTLLAGQWLKPTGAQSAEESMGVTDKVVEPAGGAGDGESPDPAKEPTQFTWRNKTALYQVQAPAGVDPEAFFVGFPY